MTHTPGPYHTTRADDSVWIEARVGGGIARLAILDDGAGTQPGNADLFAAAPDMLEALILLYELVSSDCVSIPDEQYAKVAFAAFAIDKAEGRTE